MKIGQSAFEALHWPTLMAARMVAGESKWLLSDARSQVDPAHPSHATHFEGLQTTHGLTHAAQLSTLQTAGHTWLHSPLPPCPACVTLPPRLAISIASRWILQTNTA